MQGAYWFRDVRSVRIRYHSDLSCPFFELLGWIYLMEIVNVVFTLLMLVFLQAVLGFDNLLYVSLESKRVEESKQSYVRRMGIGLAIGFRIILLFVVVGLIGYFTSPFAKLAIGGEEFYWLKGDFTVESVIVLVGGVFIIYTAFKEIFHILSIEHLGHDENAGESQRTVKSAIFWIVLMNIVFSFDSILSARALTENTVLITISIVASGILMIVMADRVSEFLKKNRMYEVLGLFILFIVGVMLVSEGAHTAHLKCLNYEIHKMEKSTFYFVIVILVLIDIAQSRYQGKLARKRKLSH